MSTSLDRPAWSPPYGWWVLAAIVVAAGLISNWVIAAGLMLAILSQLVRPLDFLQAFLVVVAGASFIQYDAGHLTFELSILTIAILIMLFTYVVSNRTRIFALARTGLTVPLVVYLSLSLANFVRGLLVGNSAKFAALQLFPVLALASCLLVANIVDPRRNLVLAVWGLLVIAFANAFLGLGFFALYKIRTAGVYFTPVPGMIAMLAVNLALRSKRPLRAVGWTLLSLPLFLHQLVSFTRGYWVGCLAGILVSVLLYSGIGQGTATRWRRAGLVLGMLAGTGLAAILAMAVMLGLGHFLELAGNRFESITGTEFTSTTASNVSRLVEYATAVKYIGNAPWFGYGLGSTIVNREPISFRLIEQAYVHQFYLLVWIEQGLVGLISFLWMIWAATALGVRESRRCQHDWSSAWLAATAASTVFLAVLCLTNFHYGQVNPTFPLALMWGAAMAMSHKGFVHFRWAMPAGRTEEGRIEELTHDTPS
jgi:O-antigen ligase